MYVPEKELSQAKRTYSRNSSLYAAQIHRHAAFRAPIRCAVACVLAMWSGGCVAKKVAFLGAKAPFVLSLVGTNDLHGHIDQLAWFGGQMANLRESRAEDGAVVLVDAGDVFQGTLASNLTEGQVVVEAYNKLGYDALAIGNHDFDYGPAGPAATPLSPTDDPRGALKARAKQASFPFLAANVWQREMDVPLVGENIAPTAMLVRKGLHIGLIGVTTQDTAGATIAPNFAGLSMQPLAPTITRYATALRSQGAHVVIVVAHAGGACAAFQMPNDLSSCSENSEIFAVAKALAPGLVNAIVAGHTHAGVAHEVNGIPIIEAHSYGRAFGRVDLILDPQFRVTGHHLFPPHEVCAAASGTPGCAERHYEMRPIVPDPAVAALVKDAAEEVRKRGDQSLNTRAVAPIERAYKTESALGNLFADLMRAARPAADVAITNAGGLRADLPSGPLKYRHLYEAMPFDNTFASATVTATQLASVFRRNLQSDKGILSISGLRVQAQCRQGQLRVRFLRKDGSLVYEDERLVLFTTNFLATGGDGLVSDATFALEALPTVRDEMARVLNESRHDLDPEALRDPNQPRIIYPGSRPVLCN